MKAINDLGQVVGDGQVRDDVRATRHPDRSEEIRLRQALQVIIRWCDRSGEDAEGQCLHEIEQHAMKALGIGGIGGVAADPVADVRKTALADAASMLRERGKYLARCNDDSGAQIYQNAADLIEKTVEMPSCKLRHGCLAALGFLGGMSILSKEQLKKVLVDAVKASGSNEMWRSA